MATLEESHVSIWYRSTTLLDDDAIKAAGQTLSTEERARRDRLHFAADRRDFTVAHDLLRRALSMRADMPPAGWRFAADERGKPSIENAEGRGPSFSLAHTRECVACAITASAPLGIDVERIDQTRRVQEIADRYFSKEEAGWLRRCSDDIRHVRFTELWALKEAFLKATGVGLSGSLSNLSFRFDEQARIEVSGLSTIDLGRWHFALFAPHHDVRLGIAIHSAERPRVFMCRDEGDGRTLAPIRSSI